MVNFIYTKVKGVILKHSLSSLWLNFLCFLSLMCMDNKTNLDIQCYLQ